MDININVSDRFKNYIQDWDYETQLNVGGYGSGKSYVTAQKIIIALLEKKRKCLVVRNVYETLKESCYDLIKEILEENDLLSSDVKRGVAQDGKVIAIKSPLEFRFANGSTIIFRGLDNKEKIKSINGVSIVWVEECSEIRYSAFLELLGRIRTPGISLHYILTCNPVGRECWVYQHFFVRLDNSGNENVICDEQTFYKRKTLVRYVPGSGQTLYMHSTMDDNPFLPQAYRDRIDGLKYTDAALWLVARWGRFGANGWRVLPNFVVAKNARMFRQAVYACSSQFHFFGLDFGFEESFNALVSCCVDDKNKILYIYDEVYVNHVTDDVFAEREDVRKANRRAQNHGTVIVGDCEEPKTITYYNKKGIPMRGSRKFAGSRLQYTKKMKRFAKIICSPKCKNVIRELKDLTYAKDSRGNIIYDQFTIDPHCFSALWYALDTYDVADVKTITNSRKGGNIS